MNTSQSKLTALALLAALLPWAAAAAQTRRETVTVTLDSGATSTLTSQTRVTASTEEANPGDEAAAESTTVTSRADLTIAMRDGADPAVAGETLTYTVTVTNHGPSDARYVEVTSTPPAGATVAATSGCAESLGVPLCSLGILPAGGEKTYTVEIKVHPDLSGKISHQASVSSQTVEVRPGDESISEDTEIATRADLAVTLGDSTDPVIAGTSLTYAVKVTNRGPSDAREVVIHDTLPPGVTFASTGGCAEDPGGIPACTLGTIPAGGEKEVVIAMAVNPNHTGGIAHQVHLTSATEEASPGDEAAEEGTRVEARADLVITNRDSVDPVVAGEPLVYTVTVTNNGPSDARDVAVAGALPRGVSFEATAGCAEDGAPTGGLPTCTLGTIPAGAAKQYTIAVQVHPDATGLLFNEAAVSSTTPEDHPGDEATPRRQPTPEPAAPPVEAITLEGANP